MYIGSVGQATNACHIVKHLAHSDAELKIFGYRYFIYMASGVSPETSVEAKQIRLEWLFG